MGWLQAIGLHTRSEEGGVRGERKPLERRQHGNDSYSHAANAPIPIVQEMGTVISNQLSVISYQKPGVVGAGSPNISESDSDFG
ncbi:hypothetical protein [Chroococcidiopsis sp [FACHB-1243]]|uniref:hypothetical protein n=1 Tax=Chroococcidiopsis sp. [FACHB-1243] TaxID=2692781 RepID=UPI001786A109|nr:hypothetical protein [Chroococcidiopsis sp. [FACHB-1243]]